MKAYKCDICGSFIEVRPVTTIPCGLLIISYARDNSAADICPECLEAIRNLIAHRMPKTEENNEPETSSSEC